MAQQTAFDVVSQVDIAEVKNAVNQATISKEESYVQDKS
jgi:uncharacterized protein YajQ (UPF0234 family)